MDDTATDVRSAIPPGSNAPPPEVFGVVETALRAHFARQLPQPEEVEAPRALS